MFNILALSAIVSLACSFAPTPVTALSIDSNLNARHAHIGQAFAKRAPKRCKARSPPAGDPTTPVANSTPPASVPTTPASPPAVTPANPANTPTTTPPPTTSPSNPGRKAGLALANWDAGVRAGILRNFNFPKVSRVYDWSQYKMEGSDAVGIISVPMLSGPGNFDDWKNRILKIQGYAQYAAGFNEPDHPEQAYMSVGDAVAKWWELMEPMRVTNPGIQLISPAVSSSQRGMDWMQGFHEQCPNCADIYAAHWYGSEPTELFKYLEAFHARFGKRIWLTEFACHNFGTGHVCDYAETQQFARVVKDYLDKTDFVECWFPFVLGDLHGVGPANQLLEGDRPTALAQIYFGS